MEFQSLMPIGLNASTNHSSMFLQIISGTSLCKWKVRPASRKCSFMAWSKSGKMVCDADTNWKIGLSTEVSGSAPTTIAAAPSPNKAWPTRESSLVSQGPRKMMVVISEQTTRTRAPLLFSAKSLVRRRTVPPAKQVSNLVGTS